MQTEELITLSKQLEAEDKLFIPDEWQKKVLEHKGDACIRNGRQTGKSSVVARKCANLSIEYKGITILMIAAAQRQSSEIFQKTLKHLYTLNDAMIKKAGGFSPKEHLSAKQNMEDKRRFEAEHGLFEGNITRTECNLKNGTRILSLPTGKSGAFVRCYTVDILIGDEAAYIPEPVWLAVGPMLATSKKMNGLGWTILLSTPFGKGGYYYECCFDPDFLNIHVTTEQCSRVTKEFLSKKKKSLTKLQYAQEYLGEFVAEFNQFFKTELIKHCMTFISWEYTSEYQKEKKYYLGIDVARYGEDETAFVISELTGKDEVKIVHCETTDQCSIPDTVGRA